MDVKFGLDVRQMVYSRALMYVQAKKILPRDGHELADYLMEFNDELIRMLEVAHKLLEDEVALRNRPVIIPGIQDHVPPPRSFDVTHDLEDAPDGAEVLIRYRRVGMAWEQESIHGIDELNKKFLVVDRDNSANCWLCVMREGMAHCLDYGRIVDMRRHV